MEINKQQAVLLSWLWWTFNRKCCLIEKTARIDIFIWAQMLKLDTSLITLQRRGTHGPSSLIEALLLVS
jgi:hypothetical protein